MSDIPEGGWPEIPIKAPYETPDVPELITGVADLTRPYEVVEVLDFYKTTLIPQLACDPTGTLDPWPTLPWLLSPDRSPRTVITCRAEGELVGAWVIKNNCLYYPCAKPEFVAAIFRVLWDETTNHFDYVWANTENPTIMAFAKKAVRIPRTPTSPTVTDTRLEWRRQA